MKSLTHSGIYINDALESFGRVFVNITGAGTLDCVPYRLCIALEDIDPVIDPVDREPSVSWDQFLRDEVSEGGSFMLSVYIEKLRQRSDAAMENYRWVIATLDVVIEDDHGIELHGSAVRFDPSRFLR